MLCECGCGQPTPIAKKTDRKRGYVKGEPVRFRKGHWARTSEARVLRSSPEVIEKVASFHRGRKRSALTRQRLSRAAKRRAADPDVRRRYSEAQRRRFQRESHIGPDCPAWKGGRTMQRGYVVRWIPPEHAFASMRVKDGTVREHRLVMAEQVGRPLESGEVVHHVNGIKDDNRPENLILYGSHSEHVRKHHRSFDADRYTREVVA